MISFPPHPGPGPVTAGPVPGPPGSRSSGVADPPGFRSQGVQNTYPPPLRVFLADLASRDLGVHAPTVRRTCRVHLGASDPVLLAARAALVDCNVLSRGFLIKKLSTTLGLYEAKLVHPWTPHFVGTVLKQRPYIC